MAGERIPVVEDNELNMTLFRDVLLATGYRTFEATTCGEAVALAAEHAPDLVLMDIQLSNLDGVQAHFDGCVRTSARPPSRCSP